MRYYDDGPPRAGGGPVLGEASRAAGNRDTSSGRKAPRAFTRTSGSYAGILRNAVRPPRSSRRSRGVGRSPYPFSASALVLERCSGPASVAWYRHWHEVFLRNALRRHLAEVGDCVVYAQGPLAARAALRARRGPHQRVVMAVHFRISQADEWADKKQIRRDGTVFRAIRQMEREVIPQVDGLVYVSRWARNALLSWLPEAAAVPSAVIGNFVAPLHLSPTRSRSGTWSPSVTLIL